MFLCDDVARPTRQKCRIGESRCNRVGCATTHAPGPAGPPEDVLVVIHHSEWSARGLFMCPRLVRIADQSGRVKQAKGSIVPHCKFVCGRAPATRNWWPTHLSQRLNSTIRRSLPGSHRFGRRGEHQTPGPNLTERCQLILLFCDRV